MPMKQILLCSFFLLISAKLTAAWRALINKIVWKRSKTRADENEESGDPSNRKKSGHCGSFQEKKCNLSCPFMMPVLPIPKLEEWCLNTSIALTGTACRGVTGPPVGAVDVGVSESAYYFCIAIPGVKKDPGEFCCEVQRDGKVCVKGVTTTGGSRVTRHSRVFVMKVQQQCPSGPFNLFFTLPGPVDPRSFSTCFRSDGTFEGIIAKYEQ